MLNLHKCLHRMYKYVQNSVVKISRMLPSILNTMPLYLEGGIFFVDRLYGIDCYKLLLLGSVIWKLVWRKQHCFSQECDGGWQKDVASDWFSWLCFLQCFGVGCVTGKPSAPQKNACDFSPKVPFRNRWWKKTSWELVIQGPPGKQPLKWRCDHCWVLVTDTVGEPVSVSCWRRNEVQAVVFLFGKGRIQPYKNSPSIVPLDSRGDGNHFTAVHVENVQYVCACRVQDKVPVLGKKKKA